jgi:hypothetical protein
MNRLAKQIINDDGEQVLKEDQRWHLMQKNVGDISLLCTGEFVFSGCASGNGEVYDFKQTTRGGITCEECMTKIKEIKSVKL